MIAVQLTSNENLSNWVKVIMRFGQVFIQINLAIALATTVNAESSCSNKVRQLELKIENTVLNRGMWGVFEKNRNLKTKSVVAMQLDSRVNKIIFLLSHLCATQNGIPLNPLATYLSKNLAVKGEDKFKAELLSIGKTPQQIDKWFEFYRYTENRVLRTLLISKIQRAIDQSTPVIARYLDLVEVISHEDSPKESLQNVITLTINIDQLLFNQPYLAQALEETSHVPYWDIT